MLIDPAVYSLLLLRLSALARASSQTRKTAGWRKQTLRSPVNLRVDKCQSKGINIVYGTATFLGEILLPPPKCNVYLISLCLCDLSEPVSVNGIFLTEGILEDALFLFPQMSIEKSAFASAKHTKRKP